MAPIVQNVLASVLITTGIFVSTALYEKFHKDDAIIEQKETAPLSTAVTTTTSSKKIEMYKMDLQPSRVVYIYDEIGLGADAIAAEIVEKGKSDAPLIILLSSPGGSVLAGNMIIAAMENAKSPIYTVCVKMCASMAAMIFEYGKKRLLVNHSILMFHNATAGVQGEVAKMNSRLSLLTRYVSKLEQHVADRSGMTFDQYRLKATDEWWIDAEDAVSLKLADGILNLSGANAALVFQEVEPMMKNKKTTEKPLVDINWK